MPKILRLGIFSHNTVKQAQISSGWHLKAQFNWRENLLCFELIWVFPRIFSTPKLKIYNFVFMEAFVLHF